MNEYTLTGIVGFDESARLDSVNSFLSSTSGDINFTISNTPGGFVEDGLAIYSALKEYKRKGNKVNVKVSGYIASASSFIAMVGDEITVDESSDIMIHLAWAMAMGNQDELRNMADSLAATDKTIQNIYQEKTGLPRRVLHNLMRREKTMDAAEAIDLGFADRTDSVAVQSNLKATKLDNNLLNLTLLNKAQLNMNILDEVKNRLNIGGEKPEVKAEKVETPETTEDVVLNKIDEVSNTYNQRIDEIATGTTDAIEEVIKNYDAKLEAVNAKLTELEGKLAKAAKNVASAQPVETNKTEETPAENPWGEYANKLTNLIKRNK